MPLRSRPSLGSSQNKIPTAFRLFYIHSVSGYVKITFVKCPLKSTQSGTPRLSGPPLVCGKAAEPLVTTSRD